MKLNADQRRELVTVLAAAFPSARDLAGMLHLRMDLNLEEIAGTGTLRQVILHLITWAEAAGVVQDLVQAAVQDRPRNSGLRAFAHTYNIAVIPAPAQGGWRIRIVKQVRKLRPNVVPEGLYDDPRSALPKAPSPMSFELPLAASKFFVGKPPLSLKHSVVSENIQPPTAEAVGNTVSETRCPYPGMAPFSLEDARFFHGREGVIGQLLNHLRYHNFLLILGASGSGKSSLVAAGLLARLSQQRAALPGPWHMSTIRPGEHPLMTLALTLGGDPLQAEPTVRQFLAAHPPATRLLLVVDQLEETFSQATPSDQKSFFAAITGLVKLPACKIVATLRADFYQDLLVSDLWSLAKPNVHTLDPLRGDALRTAISAPAAAVGVQIEPTLIERLAAHAAEEPGTLPLLQETLVLLWDKVADGKLLLDAYDKLGDGGRSGLAVAVSTHADALLTSLSPDQQKLARRIFLRLIQFGEGRLDTRRQQPLSALQTVGDDPTIFHATVETLINHRLLVSNSTASTTEPLIDLTHEILISQWPTLQSWITTRRAAELQRRELENQTTQWAARGRRPKHLLEPDELAAAAAWRDSMDGIELGLSAIAVEFLEASMNATVAATSSNHIQTIPKYPVNLTPAQQAAGQKVLLDAFPTRAALAQVVRYTLGENLASISDAPNLTDIAFTLLEWAQAQGRLSTLLTGLTAQNPENTQLQDWLAEVRSPSVLSTSSDTHNQLGEPPTNLRKIEPPALFTKVSNQEIDDLVLKIVGEMVREQTDNYGQAAILYIDIWLQAAIEKAKSYDLAAHQVEEGLEILAKGGYFEQKRYPVDLSYKFTIFGFDEYAKRHIADYDKIRLEVADQIANHAKKHASEIRAAIDRPPALVAQVLDFLASQRLIRVAKAFGSGDGGLEGIQVTEVSNELKRIVREAQE